MLNLLIIIFAVFFGAVSMALYDRSTYDNKLQKEILEIESHYVKIIKERDSKYKMRIANYKKRLAINHHNEFDKFIKKYKKGLYTEAFEIYSNNLDSKNRTEFQNYIFNNIQDLIKNDAPKANQLLQKLLEFDFDNFYFLYLKMKSSFHLKNYKQAFIEILELKKSKIPDKFEESVKNIYERIIQEYIALLIDTKNLSTMYDFSTMLQDNEEYSYYDKLEKTISLIEKGEEVKYFNIQIPLKKHGRHYYVNAKINDNIKIKLLLDTGATGVSVRASIMKENNFLIVKKDVISNTANGQSKSNIYKIDKFTVEDLEFKNFNIGGIRNFPNKKSDGLLGMKFLDEFKDWKIDKVNNLLLLKR